jgi:hypothetical protein
MNKEKAKKSGDSKCSNAAALKLGSAKSINKDTNARITFCEACKTNLHRCSYTNRAA